MTTYTLKKHSVNSKALFDEIHGFIEEGIYDMDIDWESESQRKSFISLIDDWLAENMEKKLITQYKVICDKRNNTSKDIDNGIFHLDVDYTQYNCINNTQLKYTILVDEDGEFDDDIYFEFGW